MYEHKPARSRILTFAGLTLSVGAALGPVSHAQESDRPGVQGKAFKPWSFFVRGGALHRFKADIDEGGNFKINRLFIEPGVRFLLSPTTSLGFTAGYGLDDYDFSGGEGFAGLRPWGAVNSWRFSMPVRWSPNDKWTIFGFPTLRFAAERGADLSDGATAGALVGASYKVSDTLTIGPGLGVLGQIEDSVSIFPILVIDWKLTEELSLTTGRGLAATQGPGLVLQWRPSSNWDFGLGARYEKFRFRLDDSGVAPDGVGEDRSIPVYLSATYQFKETLHLALTGGVDFAGKLRLEDDRGDTIQSTDYDPAPFLGFTFRARF